MVMDDINKLEKYVKYVRHKCGLIDNNVKIDIITVVYDKELEKYYIVYKIADRYLIRRNDGLYYDPIYIENDYFSFEREKKLERILK